MLSQPTLIYLAGLPFRADARRGTSIMPLCGVFWSDEIPDFRSFSRLPEPSRLEILRLFGIRYALWKHEPLSPDDQQYWDAARAQAPNYALFQRLEVTPDVLDLQLQIEEQSDSMFNELASQATNVTVTPKAPGVESVSFKFDVAKNDQAKLPWWKRLRRSITRS